MRSATILLVDDMLTVRTIVSKTLETKMGVKSVLTAKNGKEALDILRSQKVDVILSDWNMPEMDGEELLYEVRQDSLLRNIPFIMMTANADRDFIVTAIQLGVTNYLVKPFTPAELEEKLRLAWGNFSKRNQPRHAAIPPHLVKIRIDEKILEGQLVDLSMTGALVSLKNDPSLNLFKFCEVTLELLDPHGTDPNTAVISSLYGMIVRLEAEDSFHPVSRSCHMGLYFNPMKMNTDVAAKLSRVLKWLSNRTPELIGEK